MDRDEPSSWQLQPAQTPFAHLSAEAWSDAALEDALQAVELDFLIEDAETVGGDFDAGEPTFAPNPAPSVGAGEALSLKGLWPNWPLDEDESEAVARRAVAGVIQALSLAGRAAELSVSLVGSKESQRLNHTYRGKAKPTNVLSFPCMDEEECADFLADSTSGRTPSASLHGLPVMLGDLVLAVPIVMQEAQEQQKDVISHYSHLIIHGLLHLLGRDHIHEDEAEAMEAEERAIMAALGFSDPYSERLFALGEVGA